MKKNILISIIIFLGVISVSCQTDNSKELAQENFEEYFKKFKAAYPADKFDYTFTKYSELFELRPYPDHMVYLSRLDSTNFNDKFYSLYAHKISLLNEQDAQLDELSLSDELKNTYKKLNDLALSSKLSEEHNFENELELAEKLRELMKKERLPLSGYGQTVHSRAINDEGKIIESEIFIEYDLELNVVNIGSME